MNIDAVTDGGSYSTVAAGATGPQHQSSAQREQGSVVGSLDGPNHDAHLLVSGEARRFSAGQGFANFEVHRSRIRKSSEGTSASGASMGTGWVSSIALIGQEILVIRP